MQELISKICARTGISPEQAQGALETVKNFVKEKMPMMAGQVDSLFAAGVDSTAKVDPAAPVVHEDSFLDKISDFIPGETGQKVEDFAKGAAHKAEDAFDNVKDKLSGFMDGNKK